jgi:2-polyprenyl-6-methoxyphenol hydroxylase-like FAD-dependent oxidoreductase
MRIGIIGGGPGGLYLAALLKAADPRRRVDVFERNRRDDTFGFGVVFSDSTVRSLAEGDPIVHRGLVAEGVHWDDIEVRLRGSRIRCGGNGFVAIARHRLLGLLHDRCQQLGVRLHFESPVALEDLREADLVVAADGVGSAVRERLREVFQPTVTTGRAKFIWLGTTASFDALTFVFERREEGWFAVHGYPSDRSTGAGTFIVETDGATWRRAGLDAFDVTQPPGPSDLASRAYLESVFRDHLRGHTLLVNNSRWASFRTVRCRRWRAGRMVLLGDAAHTAHFSVGSGTRMAMQDALALAQALEVEPSLEGALERYEAERRPEVERIQGAARPSLSWWEHFGTYAARLEPLQFAYHFLTRSGRVDHRRLQGQDPGFVQQVEAWFATYAGLDGRRHPLRVPLRGPVVHPVRLWPLEAGLPSGAVHLAAPLTEDGLGAAFHRADRAAADGATMVAVAPGVPSTVESNLCVTRLAEHVRLELGVPVLLEAPDADVWWATTMVLSGRADLIGVPEARIGPMLGSVPGPVGDAG